MSVSPQPLRTGFMNSADESPEAALRVAHKAEESGRIADALRGYRDVLRHDPRAAEAFLGVGRITLLLGQFERALENFTAALIIVPDHAEGYRGRGLVFLNKGLVDRAFRDFDRALELAPDSIDARLTRGLAALDAGALDSAEADLIAVVERGSEDVDALFGLARCHARRLDLSQATAASLFELNTGLEVLNLVVGDDPMLDVLRAAVLVVEGNAQQAKSLLASAFSQEPELMEEARACPTLVGIMSSWPAP